MVGTTKEHRHKEHTMRTLTGYIPSAMRNMHHHDHPLPPLHRGVRNSGTYDGQCQYTRAPGCTVETCNRYILYADDISILINETKTLVSVY